MIASPIVFTDHAEQYRRVIHALGGESIHESPGWSHYELASGRIGLHSPSDDSPAGTVRFVIEVDDVPAWNEQFGGMMTTEAHGLDSRFTTFDGVQLGAAEIADAPAGVSGMVTIMPIWVTPDVQQASELLIEMGFKPRINSDNGVWADFLADAGGAAVHRGERGGVTLAFEYDGNVEDLLPALEGAGADPLLIDEAYGRSLQFADPNGGDRIWINEKQTDLYGYSAH